MNREQFGGHEDEAEAFDLGSEGEVLAGVQEEIDKLEAQIAVEANHETLVKLTHQLRALKEGKKLIPPQESIH